jgi:hypothetical protein
MTRSGTIRQDRTGRRKARQDSVRQRVEPGRVWYDDAR